MPLWSWSGSGTGYTSTQAGPAADGRDSGIMESPRAEPGGEQCPRAGSHVSGLVIDMLLWAAACTRLPERQVVRKKLSMLDKRVAATSGAVREWTSAMQEPGSQQD